jgi:intein/homing endonuclease
MNDYTHLCGWVDDPPLVEKAMGDLPIPVFSSIYKEIADFKDSGKNKKMFLYDIIRKVAGTFPIRLQKIGDCQNPSSMVRMFDGSEKQIKDIKIGDYVLTPYGNTRKVIDFIKKPYNKKMVRIYVSGYKKPIESTPDHLYMYLPNIGRGKKGDKSTIEWKAIAALNEGDYVLLPKLPSLNEYKYDLNDLYSECITDKSDFKKLRTSKVSTGKIRSKGSSKEINRFINLDEKLCWLIGIYAAEGGIDNGRITFNLSSKEVLLANKIKSYIKDIFDFDAIISSVPSKPSVLYVRIQNHIISSLFNKLCTGNVYNKQLDKSLLITTKQNKLQILSGWMDGDGWKNRVGVSVSEDLIYDMFQIANSIDINCSIQKRKAYKHSKESFSLNVFCGLDTLTKESLDIKINQKQITKYGRAARISKIEIVEPETDHVYCIGVEEDHSFICNGYGIHNCVSMGAAYAVDAIKAVDIYINKDFEEWVSESATEDIYWGSRNIIGKGQLGNEDGSLGVWAAKYVNQYGCVARGKYGGVDLTNYSGERAKAWGKAGYQLPPEFLEIEKQHSVITISQVNSYEEVRDLICNGYAVTIASNQGFSQFRDSEGFSKPEGSWGHQMSILGVDDEYKRPGALIQNSWGANWIAGPKRNDQPDGSFWVDAEELERRILKTGDCWAFSGYEGFKPRTINTRII